MLFQPTNKFFFLTTNQSTIPLAMAYQPNEQGTCDLPAPDVRGTAILVITAPTSSAVSVTVSHVDLQQFMISSPRHFLSV